MKKGVDVCWLDLVVLIPASIALCFIAFKLHLGLQIMKAFLE